MAVRCLPGPANSEQPPLPAPGRKTLRLPRKAVVTDLVTGQKLGPATDRVVVEMGKGETRLLGW